MTCGLGPGWIESGAATLAESTRCACKCPLVVMTLVIPSQDSKHKPSNFSSSPVFIRFLHSSPFAVVPQQKVRWSQSLSNGRNLLHFGITISARLCTQHMSKKNPKRQFKLQGSTLSHFFKHQSEHNFSYEKCLTRIGCSEHSQPSNKHTHTHNKWTVPSSSHCLPPLPASHSPTSKSRLPPHPASLPQQQA